MKHTDEELLNKAIDTMRNAEVDREAMSASAGRVANRLGIESKDALSFDAIESCDTMRPMLDSYRSGALSPNRALLVEAHLRDCGACLRHYRSGQQGSAVDWSAPKIGPKAVGGFGWRPRNLGFALACAAGILGTAVFVYRAYWEVPPGVRAEVESIDGSAYVLSDTGDRKLAAGSKLQEGEHLRTVGGSHAVLRLSDGSSVEVNERSELVVGARGRNLTVSLDDGAMIVQAAKRESGHLYVKTPDCRVAVTGTVFSVNSGIKGSRVAVLQGNVRMMHAGLETTLHAGDQMATTSNLAPVSFEQQVGWSQDRDKYLLLVAQFATLRNRIGQIPFPVSRYGSDLLARVPADTLLYVSIPNLGDFVSEANTIFHDQLSQSPELEQWWDSGHNGNTAELNEFVDKLHDVSQYLGDEIVIVGMKRAQHPGFAVLADVQKSGLGDELKQLFPASGPHGGITVFDESTLKATPDSAKSAPGGFALLLDHEAVFSGSIATLKEIDSQLNAGNSGFASGDFGKQIAAAYDRGAGIILAADLHQIMSEPSSKPRMVHGNNQMIASSGIDGVQYLIAEHRETNGSPENHINLQFSGARQRLASWLASPAPIQSLDFVSTNASLAVAALSKDPKAIADDMIAMISADHGASNRTPNAMEQEIITTVHDEIAANLGGDFLVSLDGPVLPTPSWKAVIEVHDSQRLEAALEHLVQMGNELAQGKDAHHIGIEPSDSNGQRFYTISDTSTGTAIAQYTFSDGFMIVAPNRALLIDAIKIHESGSSLARSDAFKALLPSDENENYSAVAYQNLGPVLTPLLTQLNGETANAIRKLAADSKPTAVCAWGKESRIEAASNSRLFGLDFLTLGALIDSRNKPAGNLVRE